MGEMLSRQSYNSLHVSHESVMRPGCGERIHTAYTPHTEHTGAISQRQTEGSRVWQFWSAISGQHFRQITAACCGLRHWRHYLRRGKGDCRSQYPGMHHDC